VREEGGGIGMGEERRGCVNGCVNKARCLEQYGQGRYRVEARMGCYLVE
jgi:hypothetical protein